MTFLDQLKRTGALACDMVENLGSEVGAQVVVSIVISHPGRTDDALVIGAHELHDLSAILEHMQDPETIVAAETVTRDGVVEGETLQ